MTLEYSAIGMVFGLKGQRSMLGLGLTAIRRGFELYECLLVFATIDNYVHCQIPVNPPPVALP